MSDDNNAQMAPEMPTQYGHVYEIECRPQSAPYMTPLPEGPMRIVASSVEDALRLVRYMGREVISAKKVFDGVQWK